MTPERAMKIARLKKNRFPNLILLVENVDDPHNLGAILRTCDAVGVGEVHLVYPVRGPRMRELRSRSAASATKWLKLVRHQSISKAMASLHRKKFSVFVAALKETGKPQWEHRLTGKVVIAVGNEHTGASTDLLRLADGVITIPMRGMVQSLNVSVATAVILEEALRQRLVRKQKRTR